MTQGEPMKTIEHQGKHVRLEGLDPMKSLLPWRYVHTHIMGSHRYYASMFEMTQRQTWHLTVTQELLDLGPHIKRLSTNETPSELPPLQVKVSVWLACEDRMPVREELTSFFVPSSHFSYQGKDNLVVSTGFWADYIQHLAAALPEIIAWAEEIILSPTEQLALQLENE